MSTILKSKTATATKAITVRIPVGLHEKIKILRTKAAAKNKRLDLSAVIVEQLEKAVDKTLKEFEHD